VKRSVFLIPEPPHVAMTKPFRTTPTHDNLVHSICFSQCTVFPFSGDRFWSPISFPVHFFELLPLHVASVVTEKCLRAVSAPAHWRHCKTDTGDFHCIFLYNLKPLLVFHSFHAVQFRKRILRSAPSRFTGQRAGRQERSRWPSSLSGRRCHTSMRQL
jgi:hypothetical protein